LKKALFTKEAGSDGHLEQVIQYALLNSDDNVRKIEKLIKEKSEKFW